MYISILNIQNLSKMVKMLYGRFFFFTFYFLLLPFFFFFFLLIRFITLHKICHAAFYHSLKSKKLIQIFFISLNIILILNLIISNNSIQIQSYIPTHLK